VTAFLGIDPGCTETAYALIRGEDRRPAEIGKIPNSEMRRNLWGPFALPTQDVVIGIEMVASYGMAVGAEVFETCVWIGRFQEIRSEAELVYRREVKLHHCKSAAAKDANITQALLDRFAPGVPNHGKGTKAAPGFFYGFKADIWQAFALAVYLADRAEGFTP
jgi:hypothetical protein